MTDETLRHDRTAGLSGEPQHSSDAALSRVVEAIGKCMVGSSLEEQAEAAMDALGYDEDQQQLCDLRYELEQRDAEASHHAELVEALYEAVSCLTAILVDYGVDRHRPRAEAATNVFHVLLTKIRGNR